MTNQPKKALLRKLNSPRVRAINEYINGLHDKINELYEALIDNEIDDAVSIQRKLSAKLRSLKIDNPSD